VLDIRDLISVDDVMEDDVLQMGPNGGLIFCMEFVFCLFQDLQGGPKMAQFFSDNVITHFLLILRVKKFRKSVNI